MLPSPASHWGGRGALRKDQDPHPRRQPLALRTLASGEGGLSQAASREQDSLVAPSRHD